MAILTENFEDSSESTTVSLMALLRHQAEYALCVIVLVLPQLVTWRAGSLTAQVGLRAILTVNLEDLSDRRMVIHDSANPNILSLEGWRIIDLLFKTSILLARLGINILGARNQM
mgnify:CR=1 FL=1